MALPDSSVVLIDGQELKMSKDGIAIDQSELSASLLSEYGSP